MRLFRFLSITLGLAALIYFALTLYTCHRVEPGADFARQADGVSMQDVKFQSNSLGREMRYRVYLPQSLPVGQKFPVVYLLHGNDGSFRDWSNHTDVAQYAARGVILVMPEGESSYYMNAVEKPQDKYEDYVMHDLIGDVETRFPAQSGRANRAIVGVSMGGFAAVTLALHHPDMFVFAGAISPAIDVPERRFTWKRASQWWRFRSIFGPWGSAERDVRDPFVLIRTADPRTTPYLYLTAGEQEPLLDPIQRFAGRLQAAGIPHEFHTKPGGHNWSEWDEQIPGCFQKLLTVLGKP
jgi:S-formylglutathione hydrolase